MLVKQGLGVFFATCLAAITLGSGTAIAEGWTAAEMTAFIVAASWCSKEEGHMSRAASITMGSDLLRWMEREYGISREQVITIGRDRGFDDRWRGMIRAYGGCRGLLEEVYEKTGFR